MQVERSGIILNTEHFSECVDFYRQLFELPLMFEILEEDFRLCCLRLGDSYLMIETEGVARPQGKSIAENPTKLRFNVADMESALRRVREYGIEAEINDHPWGRTIDILDPDGNRVGIRDEAGFRRQLLGEP
ncbi:VOC family protein [Aestuariirhabdus litorea]|uniref:Glyoxalase/bleomycin resistance/dioxygenase family protein n=1 Tax=Aestuariirhabdus litorea TaxID=2528527 RepID=A0A3P3VRG0_9GAMM|nr:VOC family protein [Aestuariirhabdus litorea]RRJ83393.1 glyoxalase/bleomycin resistance/dioxygenase family protein [Aestuariirhabdus litorea]RWW93554.1 glyoxalase/bleomycin resistance/dioxygenase family protein [Endozoicomonadaceae bacterium GTF-13]